MTERSEGIITHPDQRKKTTAAFAVVVFAFTDHGPWANNLSTHLSRAAIAYLLDIYLIWG
jgi:hypothetical protein